MLSRKVLPPPKVELSVFMCSHLFVWCGKAWTGHDPSDPRFRVNFAPYRRLIIQDHTRANSSVTSREFISAHYPQSTPE